MSLLQFDSYIARCDRIGGIILLHKHKLEAFVTVLAVRRETHVALP